MQFEDFKDHTMVCNSTGIQPVNLLPALQFNCQRVMILSTKHTEDNGLTNRLIEILKKHNIKSDVEIITEIEEKISIY